MTEGQLTHLSVTMRRLDEALAEIENGLKPDCPKQIMTVYDDDLSPSLRPVILGEIQRLRSELWTVKRRYSLPVDTVSNRRRFIAQLSLLSIDLEGAKSRHMAAYGILNEAERRPLDEQINGMIDVVDNVQAMIGALPIVPEQTEERRSGKDVEKPSTSRA